METLLHLLKDNKFRIAYSIGKWILKKTLLNPKSPVYYKKIFEALKTLWFALKITALLAVLKMAFNSKSSNKDLEEKAIVFIALSVLVIAVVAIAHDSKKNLPPTTPVA